MKEWEAKARAAFERYIEDLKEEIEPGSGMAGVEAAMMRLSPRMLGKVMESLGNSEEAIPPPRDTAGVGEKRATVEKYAKRVRKGKGQSTTAKE
jgi:hypothetical protein